MSARGETRERLRIEDVYKSYGRKVVLENIDLKVSPGELCTVIGPSGCGKSTLLRLILGQEVADAGTLLIDGVPVSPPDTQRGIVYQRYSLFPNCTVLDNVLLGKTFTEGQWWNPFHRNRAHLEEAEHFLNQVRLWDARDKFPAELSGGMQQRAAIAQALIMRPPILLMDEPFGALDPDTRDDLQVFLLDLWEREQLTIFFVTHDLVEACYVGTRLLVLSQYYSDDRGDLDPELRGGKLVADHQLPTVASSTAVKESPEFAELINTVRAEGFDPAIAQHVTEFNLTHPDAFQTLTAAEHDGAAAP